jgi:hypothetical protein
MLHWMYRDGYRLTGAALWGEGQAAFVSVFLVSLLMPWTKATMGVRPFMPRPWCGRLVL